VFLQYVVWRLCKLKRALKQACVILLEQELNQCLRFSVDGHQCNVQVGTRVGFMNDICDKAVYYLTDGLVPVSPMGGRSARALEVSSPQPARFKEFTKQGNPTTLTLYMPTLSLEEILLARQLLYDPVHSKDPTEEQVRRAFAVLGGVFRNVLMLRDPCKTPEQAIDEALAKSDIAALIMSEGARGQPQDVSNALVHWNVETRAVNDDGKRVPPYGAYSLDFASQYVADLVAQRHIAQVRSKALELVGYARESGGVLFGVLSGRLFESFAIEQLCHGGSFAVRRLSDGAGKADGKPESVFFSACMRHSFSQHVEIADLLDDRLGVPVQPNFASIDAVRQPRSLFQMKRAMSMKPINASGLIDALAQMRGAGVAAAAASSSTATAAASAAAAQPFRLYLVVPDTHFNNKLGALSFKGSAGTLRRLKRRFSFEQWVLSIPLSRPSVPLAVPSSSSGGLSNSPPPSRRRVRRRLS
jgi:hypothetical protein